MGPLRFERFLMHWGDDSAVLGRLVLLELSLSVGQPVNFNHECRGRAPNFPYPLWEPSDSGMTPTVQGVLACKTKFSWLKVRRTCHCRICPAKKRDIGRPGSSLFAPPSSHSRTSIVVNLLSNMAFAGMNFIYGARALRNPRQYLSAAVEEPAVQMQISGYLAGQHDHPPLS